MKTRAQSYGQEAACLLRDITMYRVMRKEQLLRLYPGKQEKVRNLISYLVRQGRIWECEEYFCAAPECAREVDLGLLAAVWVLADFIDRVEYHSVAEYPAKIIFFADGEIYEIIHAAQGKDTLLSYVLSSAGEHPSRYLVLVDDPGQIEQLQIPHASGYCTVSPEGDVHYYQKE